MRNTWDDKPNTSDPTVSGNYQSAIGIVVGAQAGARMNRPAMTQVSRMLVTSARKGSLDLRYAPHHPKVVDVSTST